MGIDDFNICKRKVAIDSLDDGKLYRSYKELFAGKEITVIKRDWDIEPLEPLEEYLQVRIDNEAIFSLYYKGSDYFFINKDSYLFKNYKYESYYFIYKYLDKTILCDDIIFTTQESFDNPFFKTDNSYKISTIIWK